MKCRFCRNQLEHVFVDLGSSPPANSFLSRQQLQEDEHFYPLKAYVCDGCLLVQIGEYKKAEEIFSTDYAYFSSYSKSWLGHAKDYVEMITKRLELNETSFVIEVGCNDGYLLGFLKQKNIPCLGIEPAQNTAGAAREKGIDVITEFFTAKLAKQLSEQGKRPDLLIGNNVLAHVPKLNDFVEGLKIVLKGDGVITMEFPHLMRLVEDNQFDTIYHEHFSYFSFHTVSSIFAVHGLKIFDVEELSTHGGSLRIYAKHSEDTSLAVSSRCTELLGEEQHHGMLDLGYYLSFQKKVEKVKCNLLSFLDTQKAQGNKIAAYGAAAKGNTLLNYCGIGKDTIAFVADASGYKQGKYLPGVHIPVVGEEQIRKAKPNLVLILPWNLKGEISGQLAYIRDWGGRFVVPVPDIEIF